MKQCGVEFGELPLSDYFWKSVSSMEDPLDYVTRLSLTFEQANLDFTLTYRPGDTVEVHVPLMGLIDFDDAFFAPAETELATIRTHWRAVGRLERTQRLGKAGQRRDSGLLAAP